MAIAMTALLASFVERHMDLIGGAALYVAVGAAVLLWLRPDGEVDD